MGRRQIWDNELPTSWSDFGRYVVVYTLLGGLLGAVGTVLGTVGSAMGAVFGDGLLVDGMIVSAALPLGGSAGAVVGAFSGWVASLVLEGFGRPGDPTVVGTCTFLEISFACNEKRAGRHRRWRRRGGVLGAVAGGIGAGWLLLQIV